MRSTLMLAFVLMCAAARSEAQTVAGAPNPRISFVNSDGGVLLALSPLREVIIISDNKRDERLPGQAVGQFMMLEALPDDAGTVVYLLARPEGTAVTHICVLNFREYAAADDLVDRLLSSSTTISCRGAPLSDSASRTVGGLVFLGNAARATNVIAVRPIALQAFSLPH